jgi:hypothetical protein
VLTRLVALALSASLLLAVPAQAKAPKAPTVKVVKKLLKENYGDGSSLGHQAKYTFKRVKVSKSRKGDLATDGVKPGIRVWPAHAKFTLLTYNTGDKWSMTTVYDAKILVYRDDFGDWTYTNKVVKSKNTRCTSTTGDALVCP